MLLEELAKDMVEVTSALVNGRTINIMDTNGIIVASSEHGREGTFHQGAWEAVQTGRVVNIHKDQLSSYPGAREGCNMPLRINGTIIGAVGIFGEPEDIRDVAHLLEVYAAKYYQLEAMLRPRLSESALRSQLLQSLLSQSSRDLSGVQSLAETLNLHFQFPLHTVVISLPEGKNRASELRAVAAELDNMKLLHSQCDVWGAVDQRLVLLCSTLEGRDLTALRELTGRGCRISLGDRCMTLWEIPKSYEQASTLDQIGQSSFNDIRQTGARCQYMLECTASLERSFLEELYQRLQDAFGPKDCDMLLESVRMYYACERSVSTAAQQLFIHKNTLQYRTRRVLEVLGIGKLPTFWQEYVIRLLLEHSSRKSRSKDLEK